MNEPAHRPHTVTVIPYGSQATHARQPCAGRTGDGLRDQGCLESATIERDGIWWCRHHDPLQAAALRAVQDREWSEQQAHEAVIGRERKRLATRLGVEARAHLHPDSSSNRSGDQKCLVVSFEDVEKLIKRLERTGRPRPPGSDRRMPV